MLRVQLFLQLSLALRTHITSITSTVGIGNHYVDLFTDEEDRVWIGVHFATVYDAGRALGRREATGVVNRKTGEGKLAGKVTPEMMRAWVNQEMMRAWVNQAGVGLFHRP